MSKGKYLTEQVFKGIKLMQRGGATVDDIKEFYPVSNDTLRRIKKVDTFADYLANQRAKFVPKTPEAPQAKPETIKCPWELVQEFRRTNEILTLISAKLAFIVDELTGTPGGKGDGAE